jgi:hypothetical protein
LGSGGGVWGGTVAGWVFGDDRVGWATCAGLVRGGWTGGAVWAGGDLGGWGGAAGYWWGSITLGGTGRTRRSARDAGRPGLRLESGFGARSIPPRWRAGGSGLARSDAAAVKARRSIMSTSSRSLDARGICPLRGRIGTAAGNKGPIASPTEAGIQAADGRDPSRLTSWIHSIVADRREIRAQH